MFEKHIEKFEGPINYPIVELLLKKIYLHQYFPKTDLHPLCTYVKQFIQSPISTHIQSVPVHHT